MKITYEILKEKEVDGYVFRLFVIKNTVSGILNAEAFMDNFDDGMATCKIDLKFMLNLLKEHTDFTGKLKIYDTKKSTRGNCCTCQKCGHYHDNCVCLHNMIVYDILKHIRGEWI